MANHFTEWPGDSGTKSARFQERLYPASWMQSGGVLHGSTLQGHQEKYAAVSCLCKEEIEMRCKVSAHRNR